MRRVLFDENVPRDLRRELPAFEIHTWAGELPGQVGHSAHLLACGADRECRDDDGMTSGRDRFLLREQGAARQGLVTEAAIAESMEKAR